MVHHAIKSEWMSNASSGLSIVDNGYVRGSFNSHLARGVTVARAAHCRTEYPNTANITSMSHLQRRGLS